MIYNGAGDTGLQFLLSRILTEINALLNSAVLQVDFYLGNTLFSTASDQISLCNIWAALGHKDLRLVLKNNLTYTAAAATTLQFIDTKPNGFASTYLSSGSTLTGTTTVGGYGTPATFNVLWEGRSYIRLMCNVARGYRESRSYAGGMIESGLLAIVPATGAPGNWEYYVSQSNEGVTVQDLAIDQLSFMFQDEMGNELTDITDYSIVLSVDYFDRDPKNKEPTMDSSRTSMTF